MTANSQTDTAPFKASHLGLYLLLGAIVLGVLVGAFYGRRMWLASGGPQAALLMLIYWMFTRKSPFTFTANMLKAIVTAASTSSSSATLPVTMECVEVNNGISNRSRVCRSAGGDGKHERHRSVRSRRRIELSFPELLVVMLTATLAAIGAAGIPEAS